RHGGLRNAQGAAAPHHAAGCAGSLQRPARGALSAEPRLRRRADRDPGVDQQSAAALVEECRMTLSNSNSPLARREALADRREQLTRMVEIRAVEERIQKLFAEGHIRGSTHLASGQEAVSVGIARAIDPDDIVTCTYRGHGHALALGVTPTGVIGEICGRVVGCAGGLGGSMHLVEPAVGLLPTAAIIGAGLAIACGVAMAARARGKDRVAVAVFGAGSANIGAFHEALNFAAIQKLPVVFVCEKNPYDTQSEAHAH